MDAHPNAAKPPSVFISYRRADTASWAGRLHADLARVLTASELFMDLDGRIKHGDKFGDVIDNALGGCRALLVLIGPKWATVERDSKPRLEHEDDWVRHEIEACLAREEVVIVPVLFGDASPPDPKQLPESIRGVAARDAASITDKGWAVQVARLVGDLEYAVPELEVRRPTFGRSVSALSRLGELANRSPAVAQAVGAYREGFNGAARDVAKIEAYKVLHDAFHTIEFECYRPLLSRRRVRGLWPVRRGLGAARTEILDCLERHVETVPEDLSVEIQEDLETAFEAVESAKDAERPEEGVEEVLEALAGLLGRLPAELDERLAVAARSLQSRRLDDLMRSVGDVAGKDTADDREKRELSELFDDLANLGPARVELEVRVEEHSKLQKIDGELRVAVDSRSPRVPWKRVRKQLGRLRPFSKTLREAWGDIRGSADAVDAALEDGIEVVEALREHHSVVASTFRYVDKEVKALSAGMTQFEGPLRTLAKVASA